MCLACATRRVTKRDGTVYGIRPHLPRTQQELAADLALIKRMNWDRLSPDDAERLKKELL